MRIPCFHLLLCLFQLLNSALAGEMSDTTLFGKSYQEIIDRQLNENSFNFRLVDQFGTPLSLSDYSNQEVSLYAIHPQCHSNELLKSIKLLKKKRPRLKILLLNSDIQLSREELINQYPDQSILMDENQQVASSLNFMHAGDFVSLNQKKKKIIASGNIYNETNFKIENDPNCKINYVEYIKGTFKQEILPALNRSCIKCHFEKKSLNYFQDIESMHSWREMMLRTIRLKRMPPGADPYYSHLLDHHTSQDILKITKWLESKDFKEPETEIAYQDFIQQKRTAIIEDNKNIEGELITLIHYPDEVVDASGAQFYKHYLTNTPTTKDYFFRIFEVKINSDVAHHVALHYSSKPFPKVDLKGNPIVRSNKVMRLYGNNPEAITGFSEIGKFHGTKFNDPNIIHIARESGLQFSPNKSIYFVPKGSYLNLEIHYNPSGKKEISPVEISIYHNEQIKMWPKIKRFSMMPNMGVVVAKPFQKNNKVTMSYTLKETLHLSGYGLHMHYRGRSGKLLIQKPGDKSPTIVFSFPTYQYKNQLNSQLENELELPVGTRIISEIIYDNSSENDSNPDPSKAVKIGTSILNEENYLPRIVHKEIIK
jgi:hypothetical protein